MMDSPANLDFPSADREYVSRHTLIFGVQHKKRDEEPFVRCEDCHGSGMAKCERCDGTGREQYVEGTYANGEDRVRTGACPECGGRGRYSVAKSVEETCYHHTAVWYWTPWRSYSVLYSLTKEQEDTQEDDPADRVYRYSEKRAVDAIFSALNNSVVVRKKNRNAVLLDRTDELLAEMEKAGLRAAYEKNKGRVSFDDNNLFIERDEAHIIIPAKRVTISARKDSLIILAYETGADQLQIVIPSGMGYMEKGKFLLLRFYYFLVQIGKLVLRPFAK